MGIARLVLSVMAVAGLAACNAALPAAVPRGYPLGPPVSCEKGSCDRQVLRARAWLDGAEPGHPAIVGFQGFVPEYRTPDGQLVQPADGPVQQRPDDRLGGCVAGQLVQVPLDGGGGPFLTHGGPSPADDRRGRL